MAIQKTSYITGDAAFAVDRHGVIVSWNPAAEKMFGYQRSTAVGQRCWQLLSGEDIYGNRYCCKNCPLMRMVRQRESVHSFHAQFKTASDGMKNITVNCLQVYDGASDSLLMHICSISEDAQEHPQDHHHSGNNHHPGNNHHSGNNHATARPSANVQRGALTNRELEVLALLAEGKTTREIAKTLCIGVATARNHIQHTLYKLHVHNRLEAVVIGQRLDLV